MNRSKSALIELQKSWEVFRTSYFWSEKRTSLQGRRIPDLKIPGAETVKCCFHSIYMYASDSGRDWLDP